MAYKSFTFTIGTNSPDGQKRPFNNTFGAAGDPVTDIANVNTDIAQVQTDNTATLAAMDSFAAAVIAITLDTYTSHQFGGTASVGLTAAQCNTLFKTGTHPANAIATDILTGQTDTNTAATAAAAAVADAGSADVIVLYNTTNVTAYNQLAAALRTILDRSHANLS